MPLNYGDLKDKHIRLEGDMYRPYVHTFGEIDPRPLDLCASLVIAQKVLAKYPSDCYEGSLIGEKGWEAKVDRQVDVAYRVKQRRKSKRSRRKKSGCFGRTFAKARR